MALAVFQYGVKQPHGGRHRSFQIVAGLKNPFDTGLIT
jgi:hypothetical protein